LHKLIVEAWRCQAPRELVKDGPPPQERKRSSRR
jgi:hypothetical protein